MLPSQIRKLLNVNKLPAFPHMTLGSLVKALKRERTGLLVMTKSGWCPSTPHNYHGNTSHVAFTSTADSITVAQFHHMCEDAIQMAYLRPDNESVSIGPGALVWMSGIGEASGNAITDVIAKNGIIELIIKNVND